MAEEKAKEVEPVVQTEQKEAEMNRTGEAMKENKSKTKKVSFPFHFWKKKKSAESKETEEPKTEAAEMKQQTAAESESEALKQESGVAQSEKTEPMKEVMQPKDSSSSSSSSSQEQGNQQKEDQKNTFAEAVAAKQNAPTGEQPKMDIPKPEPETKKKPASKGIFSIFHRKPSKEREAETSKAPAESSQDNQKPMNQSEMAENAIADMTELKPKEMSPENNFEEPKPEVKAAGVEGPEDGSEANRKAGEPKVTEETESKQAEDSEAKEIPKEVSEKQSGGFFHKFLRAFGCGGDISKENTQPAQQTARA